MDGVYIYWFGWMLWIIVHFLMKKTSYHYIRSLGILLFLTLLPVTMIAGSMTTISPSFILFVIWLCWQVRRHSSRKLLNHIIGSWTVGAAYSGFQLMIIFDPVIAFMNERWISAGIVCIVSFFIAKTAASRLEISLLGLLQGDFVLTLVERHYLQASSQIGSLLFFDKVAVIGFLFGAFWMFTYCTMKLKHAVSNTQTPLERSS